MKTFNCPSCAAPVTFQSNVSVYAVCPYCKSMLVRRDVDVESIGVMAELPDDMSPLQVGTSGFFNGQRFTLIGRMRLGWTDGFWNEWFLIMDDGRRGWLAEAQGSYAISFEYDLNDAAETNQLKHQLNKLRDTLSKRDMQEILGKKQKSPTLGHTIELNKKYFQIADLKEATCVGSEGELPFRAPKGRKTFTADMYGKNGGFGSIEVDGETLRVYIGQYVEWDDMHCQYLRELEGW